jgi:hypothetical protein
VSAVDVDVRRWPLEQLIRVAGVDAPQLPRRIGVSSSSVEAGLTSGLNDRAADHWAVRLGYHPGSVWPDWFDIGGGSC